jgi:mevalonate kinase
MGKGTAFGKNILIGDQFVLNGVPAIVSALPYRTETIVERDESVEGFVVEDNRFEVPGYKKKKEASCRKSYEMMIEALKIDLKKNPLRIKVGGDLLAGSGVGASGAISVSFGKACNEEFKLGMDILEQNKAGWVGEHAYHGIPSGVDNTASTFGGLMMYMIRDGKKMYERIVPAKPLYVVLANSGITYDTTLLDKHLDGLINNDAGKFYTSLSKVTAQVYEMKKAIETGDLQAMGDLMVENHKILIDMDLSNERLIELCDRAIKMGALGAKLTGGGRGGYMVSLVEDPDMQNKIAAEFEKDDIPVIKAQLGLNAVDDVNFRILK